MHLTKTIEETDPKKVEALRRRSRMAEDSTAPDAFLVYFRVGEVCPLVKEQSESNMPSATTAKPQCRGGAQVEFCGMVQTRESPGCHLDDA
jgi:hypothetical protein